MTAEQFSKLETELGVFLPPYYKELMINYPFRDYLPVVRCMLIDDSQEVIQVNARLRSEGFKGKPWPPNFLVIGAGKEDRYFLDADNPLSQRVYAVFQKKPYHPRRLEKHLFQPTFDRYLEFMRVMNNIMNNP